MEDIKKKHHYVWKKYLSNWSKNDENKIYAYIHREKKIIYSIPENIAQQRYFYELDEFSINEEIMLYEFIKSFWEDNDKALYIDLFQAYTFFSNIKRQFDKSQNAYSAKEKEKFLEYLKTLKANTIENLHSKFEMLGLSLINMKSDYFLTFIESEFEQYNLLLFICLQYTRTKSMREKINANLRNNQLLNAKSFNILPFVVSLSLSKKLLFEKELKYIFIKNQTIEKFITTDQPVINLAYEEKDENGDVIDLRLYYPISPENALIIHYNNQDELVLNINADIGYVEELNNYQIKNSLEFVFLESENQYNKYKNILLEHTSH
jgi:hypothetical protein